MNREWLREAACRELSPEESDDIFFPTAGDADYAEARTFCDRCPVREECAATAMQAERGMSLGSRFGMFGGLAPRQRWVRSREDVDLGQPVPGINHGTGFAYRKKGCRCEPCTIAYREAKMRWHEPADHSPRDCEWCGARFVPHDRGQKYCSGAHRSLAGNARNNPKRRVA